MKIFLDGLQSTPWYLYAGYVTACVALLAAGVMVGRKIGDVVKR